MSIEPGPPRPLTTRVPTMFKGGIATLTRPFRRRQQCDGATNASTAEQATTTLIAAERERAGLREEVAYADRAPNAIIDADPGSMVFDLGRASLPHSRRACWMRSHGIPTSRGSARATGDRSQGGVPATPPRARLCGGSRDRGAARASPAGPTPHAGARPARWLVPAYPERAETPDIEAGVQKALSRQMA